MNETIKLLMNKILIWKAAFENKDLKVDHGEIKVMVSSGITKDGISKSNVGSAA